jgi:phosphate transport system protein
MERTHLDAALASIRQDLLEMGTRVEENLTSALGALKTGDQELAKRAKKGDEAVNALLVKIEDEAARLIATQQPVAGDLRMLLTLFKVTNNLERVGDHAKHLAKTAKKLSEDPWGRPLDRLERMAERGIAMTRASLDAFLARDAAKAREAASMDDLIDVEHKAFSRETLDYLRERPDRVEQGMRLLATSGYLERLGDHLTNVCEAVVFMTEGTHVELNY